MSRKSTLIGVDGVTGNKAVSMDTLFSAVKSAIGNQATVSRTKADIFGLEGVTDLAPEKAAARDDIQSIAKDLRDGIKSGAGLNDVDVSTIFGNEAFLAGSLACMASHGNKSFTKNQPVVPSRNENNMVYSNQFVHGKRDVATMAGNERFDDAKYTPYRVTTTALQLASINQGGYIDLALPTVVLGPTEFGTTITIPRGTIQDRAVQRNEDGSPTDIRKLSVIASYRAAGEDVRHANRLYPIVRDATKAKVADYAKRSVTTFTGTVEETAPLKVGESADFIKLSQPTGYVPNAATDGTTSLAPGGFLETIYLDTGSGEIVAVPVRDRNGATFTLNAVNGINGNTSNYNFETTFTFSEDNIKLIDGATDSANLKKLVADGQKVHINVNVNATLNLETGSISTSASKPYLDKVIGADGREVARDKWTADQKTFDGLKIVVDSLDHDIRRSVSNLEIFGDIVHVDSISAHFETTWNHPVSILVPVNEEESPALLTMASQAVQLNKHRMATEALLRARDQIRTIASSPYDPVRVQGTFAGALCYLPAFKEDTFKIDETMNNVKSGDVLADISGALRAMMKHTISSLVRDSGYVLAVQSYYAVGKRQEGVKIGIITSQYISDFLQVDGDNRLLGDEYEAVIEVNPSKLFDNMIMMFPTTADNGKTEISPLQFGLATYCPDVMYNTNVSYTNHNLKEIKIINRWCPHILGCVMGVINVSGIQSVVQDRIPTLIIKADEAADGETGDAGTGGGE